MPTADAVVLPIEADDKTRKGLNDAEKSLDSFGKRAGKALGTVTKAAGAAALGIGAVGVAVFEATRQWADGVIELDNLSRGLGRSIEDLSALEYAFRQVRLEVEDVGEVLAVIDFEITLDPARLQAFADAMGTSAESFASFLGSLPTGEAQIAAIAEAFVRIRDESGQAAANAAAMFLFGEDFGRQLLALLNLGGEGFTALTEEARELGVVIDQENVLAARNFEAAMRGLEAVVRSVIINVAPTIAAMIVEISDVFQEIIEWSRRTEYQIALDQLKSTQAWEESHLRMRTISIGFWDELHDHLSWLPISMIDAASHLAQGLHKIGVWFHLGIHNMIVFIMGGIEDTVHFAISHVRQAFHDFMHYNIPKRIRDAFAWEGVGQFDQPFNWEEQYHNRESRSPAFREFGDHESLGLMTDSEIDKVYQDYRNQQVEDHVKWLASYNLQRTDEELDKLVEEYGGTRRDHAAGIWGFTGRIPTHPNDVRDADFRHKLAGMREAHAAQLEAFERRWRVQLGDEHFQYVPGTDVIKWPKNIPGWQWMGGMTGELMSMGSTRTRDFWREANRQRSIFENFLPGGTNFVPGTSSSQSRISVGAARTPTDYEALAWSRRIAEAGELARSEDANERARAKAIVEEVLREITDSGRIKDLDELIQKALEAQQAGNNIEEKRLQEEIREAEKIERLTDRIDSILTAINRQAGTQPSREAAEEATRSPSRTPSTTPSGSGGGSQYHIGGAGNDTINIRVEGSIIDVKGLFEIIQRGINDGELVLGPGIALQV